MLMIPPCCHGAHFLLRKEVLRHSRLWGNIARLPASVLYDEYQQAGTRRRLPFNAPPPRLTKMAPLGMGAGPFPLGNIIGDAPLAASSRWELMKEWLERRTEHWDPSEEYRHRRVLPMLPCESVLSLLRSLGFQ
ncbi:hypothetical protein HID58_067486, partial [Brassica napus]